MVLAAAMKRLQQAETRWTRRMFRTTCDEIAAAKQQQVKSECACSKGREKAGRRWLETQKLGPADECVVEQGQPPRMLRTPLTKEACLAQVRDASQEGKACAATPRAARGRQEALPAASRAGRKADCGKPTLKRRAASPGAGASSDAAGPAVANENRPRRQKLQARVLPGADGSPGTLPCLRAPRRYSSGSVACH